MHDPDLAPPGKVAASAFALWFPVEADPERYGELKVEMGQRVIERINGIAPDFESRIIRHTTFTPKHMGTMFGAPGGDYCHGLMHADQMGPNRPGTARVRPRPAAARGALPRRLRLPRRPGHHVRPGLQRRARGAGRPLTGRIGPGAAPRCYCSDA